jgi:hypothetical protein
MQFLAETVFDEERNSFSVEDLIKNPEKVASSFYFKTMMNIMGFLIDDSIKEGQKFARGLGISARSEKS